MNLYLPIETKVREFDAKFLLSCVAAEAGYTVILGHKKLLDKRLDQMPPGIFLDKSMPERNIARYLHYKKLGFTLIAHDEEGIAPLNLDEYQRRRRYSNETLAPFEYVLTWGQWQADFIAAKAPLYKEKLKATGHPRIDLTRRELRAFYAEEVQKLREQYGAMILINTNFMLGNHFFGEDGVMELLEKSGKIPNEEQRQYYLGLQEHHKILFHEFAAMIVKLHERFADRTIIVRPHPSENHETWKHALPSTDKVQVLHEGNVLPWLMAAQVMIHNSCTTGVEAYLLERPVIAYLPIRNEAFEGYLANPLSELAFTCEELFQKVGRYLEKDLPVQPDSHKQELAKHHISGLEGELASDRIVRLLNTVTLTPGNPGRTAYQLYHRLKKTVYSNKILRRFLFGMNVNSYQNLAAQHKKQKFPGIERDELLGSLAKLQALSGRFAGIQIVSLAPNLFQITQGER